MTNPSEGEMRFYIGPHLKPPKRVILSQFNNLAFGVGTIDYVYVPLVEAFIDIHMMDDDCAVGSSACSNCKKNVDIFSKYCPNCGAKLKRREISNDSKNPTETN